MKKRKKPRNWFLQGENTKKRENDGSEEGGRRIGDLGQRRKGSKL